MNLKELKEINACEDAVEAWEERYGEKDVPLKTVLADLLESERVDWEVWLAGCSLDFCRVWLDSGADVNKSDNLDRTPLYWASRYGHTAIVKLLIAKGADVNKSNKDGRTPLYWASRYGHTATAELLIAKGAEQ